MNSSRRCSSISKYGNHKTTVDGITFDSKKEANRYLQLKKMEAEHQISCLQIQVPFELVPNQYRVINGKKTLLERAVKYRADFVYIEDGHKVVEDVKGKRTKEYILKRKMMLWIHGIRVNEI